MLRQPADERKVVATAVLIEELQYNVCQTWGLGVSSSCETHLLLYPSSTCLVGLLGIVSLPPSPFTSVISPNIPVRGAALFDRGRLCARASVLKVLTQG